MEVHITPDVEKKLKDVAAQTGRDPETLVQDVLAGYFEELAQVRTALDSRYDDLKSGHVTPVDGEAFFDQLRQREDERLKRSPQ